MRKLILIPVATLLLLDLFVTSCSPQVTPTPTGVSQEEYAEIKAELTTTRAKVEELQSHLDAIGEPIPVSKLPSEYHVASFAIEPDGHYEFSIYVREEETLFLSWQVKEGEAVWFHIITPLGKSLGFYEYQPGNLAHGTLSDGLCQAFKGGMTVFSPSESDWGEGYYKVDVNSRPSSPAKVEVWYRIEKARALTKEITINKIKSRLSELAESDEAKDYLDSFNEWVAWNAKYLDPFDEFKLGYWRVFATHGEELTPEKERELREQGYWFSDFGLDHWRRFAPPGYPHWGYASWVVFDNGIVMPKPPYKDTENSESAMRVEWDLVWLSGGESGTFPMDRVKLTDITK